jgi:hypothetical protein
MCGDFEDHEKLDDELFERFLEVAGRYGVSPADDGHAGMRLDEESARKAYMEGLFRAGLTRSVNDAVNLPHGERMDALAGQALVFARLAGFLAGQFPPQADLFRMVSGALLDGYGESGSRR